MIDFMCSETEKLAIKIIFSTVAKDKLLGP
jgi:hypothetical protein